MYLFLFSIFPAVAVWYGYSVLSSPDGKQVLKNKALCAAFGVFSAAVLCAIYAFFVFSNPYQGASILIFSLADWLPAFFVPGLFYVLYILWSNDSWEERIGSFLIFMIPFCAVYLPYFTLKQEYSASFFMAFLRPVIVVFAVFAVSRQVQKFYQFFLEKSGKMVVSAVTILLESFIPSVLTAIWFYGVNIIVVIILCILSCALSIFLAGINIRGFIEAVKSVKNN